MHNGRFLADLGQIRDAFLVTTYKSLDFSIGVSNFFFLDGILFPQP